MLSVESGAGYERERQRVRIRDRYTLRDYEELRGNFHPLILRELRQEGYTCFTVRGICAGKKNKRRDLAGSLK